KILIDYYQGSPLLALVNDLFKAFDNRSVVFTHPFFIFLLFGDFAIKCIYLVLKAGNAFLQMLGNLLATTLTVCSLLYGVVAFDFCLLFGVAVIVDIHFYRRYLALVLAFIHFMYG